MITPCRARESLDGSGAGDHDVPFVFGRLPRAEAPFLLSIHEFARLLVMRSRVRSGLRSPDELRLRGLYARAHGRSVLAK